MSIALLRMTGAITLSEDPAEPDDQPVPTRIVATMRVPATTRGSTLISPSEPTQQTHTPSLPVPPASHRTSAAAGAFAGSAVIANG
jgi:hypothetical protein